MGAESRLQASTRVRPRTLPDSSDGHRSVLLAAVLAGVVAAWAVANLLSGGEGFALAVSDKVVGGEEAGGQTPPREARRARMRKMGLLLAALAVGLLVAGGAALAATINCPGDCTGTANPDRLIGSSASQTMRGLEGGDSVSGYRGDDDVVGGRGGDAVYGGLGDDQVYGNQGNDYVEGDYGHDYINTGSGSDKVAAKDGYRDRIVCGQGNRDKVYKDRIDRTSGCEIRLERKPSP